jgi:hypothetical protein
MKRQKGGKGMQKKYSLNASHGQAAKQIENALHQQQAEAGLLFNVYVEFKETMKFHETRR